MLRDLVQFECFDMCEWLRLSKAWSRIQNCARTGTDDYIGSAELALRSIAQCGLHRPVTDEASVATNEFRSSLFVIVEIEFVQARYHRAFAVAHGRHIDSEIIPNDAEFLTSANVGCDLRTVNDVLARETGDVRARSANVFAVDHRNTLSLPGKGPCRNGRTGATAEDYQVIFFNLIVLS